VSFHPILTFNPVAGIRAVVPSSMPYLTYDTTPLTKPPQIRTSGWGRQQRPVSRAKLSTEIAKSLDLFLTVRRPPPIACRMLTSTAVRPGSDYRSGTCRLANRTLSPQRQQSRASCSVPGLESVVAACDRLSAGELRTWRIIFALDCKEL